MGDEPAIDHSDAVPGPPGAPKQPRPVVTAAVLCEQALVEDGDRVSLIRITDQVVVGLAVTEAAPRGLAVPVSVSLYVACRSNGAVGTYQMLLAHVTPGGQRRLVGETSVRFPGDIPDERPWTVVNLRLSTQEPGQHWFEVVLDDRRWARLPLAVVVEVEQEAPGNALGTDDGEGAC